MHSCAMDNVLPITTDYKRQLSKRHILTDSGTALMSR